MSATGGAKVFISYRRTDAGSRAGWLYDRLAREFGTDNVMMDIQTISWGYKDEFLRAVRACDAVLVVIGPGWLNEQDETGQRQIDRPDDVVRLEVATALATDDIRVIPILVGGANPPAADELPSELRALAETNALRAPDEELRSGGVVLPTLIQAINAAARPNTSGDQREKRAARESPSATAGNTRGDSGVFVCYRREDSRWPARQLADAMAERFGRDNVFFDVDRVRLGNWRKQVDAALEASAVIVVVIGPQWVEEFQSREGRRDEVRYEIAEAVRREKMLLPVTIGRTPVPSEDEVPDEVAALLDEEVYELLEDRLWEPTVRVLLDDLAEALTSR